MTEIEEFEEISSDSLHHRERAGQYVSPLGDSPTDWTDSTHQTLTWR